MNIRTIEIIKRFFIKIVLKHKSNDLIVLIPNKEMKRVIAISGSSGFIGRNLTRYFMEQSYDVLPITRKDLYYDHESLKNIINNADIIINLAGKSIFRPWTKHNRKTILDSRIISTQAIVSVLNSINEEKHLINASAIGIYDSVHEHDEKSTLFSKEFLFDVVHAWENEARKLQHGKLSITRFGIVLGTDAGAFPKAALSAKFGVGIIPGDGEQPFSFIHIDDLCKSIHHIIAHGHDGVFNLVGPRPIKYEEFINAMKEKQNFLLPIKLPAFLFSTVLGKAADLLISGQYVLPSHLVSSGYSFSFPTINNVLDDLM